MSAYLKKLLAYYHLVSESELFCANLQHRLCYEPGYDERNFYLGDPGSKNEDIMRNMNDMRRRCKEKYAAIFTQMIESSSLERAGLVHTVALYLAAYFELNESGQ